MRNLHHQSHNKVVAILLVKGSEFHGPLSFKVDLFYEFGHLGEVPEEALDEVFAKKRIEGQHVDYIHLEVNRHDLVYTCPNFPVSFKGYLIFKFFARIACPATLLNLMIYELT